MNPASIRTIWLTVSVVQMIFALTVMGETQGAPFVPKLKSLLGIEFLENTPDSIVALWGILFLSVLLVISSSLAGEYARIDGMSWRTRFPLRILDVDPETQIGRWFSYGGVFFGVLVPLYVLGHSWRIMQNEATLCANGGNQLLEEIGRGWMSLWVIPDGATFGSLLADGYRLAGEGGCEAGSTTFFPLFEPLFFLLLTLWGLWRLFWAAKAIFKRA